MDGTGAPRANAAQLAQRNIKAASGKGKRPAGHRATPIQSPNGAQLAQPQGTAGAQFGGGLFGGSIQAPEGGSSFNFTVTGGPPLPNFDNPFNMGNGPGMELVSENDERRDPAEERPSKKQQGASASDVPLWAPMPENPYAQTQASNIFGSTREQQNASPFNFGGASQSQQGVTFNSTPAVNPFASSTAPQSPITAPAASPFASSNSPFQPQVPTTAPSFNFGAASQAPPASNLAIFGQPPSQAGMGSTGFSFGSSTTPAQPTNSPFSFNQNPGQTPSTGINFGSVPATNTSASNLFGTSQPPSTNLFGTAAQQPASGIFAGLNSPAVPSSNVFGSRESSPAPSVGTNSLFGNQDRSGTPPVLNGFPGLKNQQPTPSNPTGNLFGTAGHTSTSSNPFGQQFQQTAANSTPSSLFGSIVQPANTSTLFGEQKSQPTSNIFGNLNSNAAPPSSGSSVFSKPVEQPIAGGSLFGRVSKPPTPSNDPSKPAEQPVAGGSLFDRISKPPTPNNDLFGNLNKPVDQAVTEPKPSTNSLFGTRGTQNQSPILFNQQASSNSLFSRASKAPSPSPQLDAATPNKPLFAFGSAQPTPAPSSEPTKTNMFSSTKPMDAPITANTPPPTGMFPSLQQPTSQPASNTEPRTMQGQPTNAAIQSLTNPDPVKVKRHNGKGLMGIGISKQVTEEFMDSLVPAHFNEHERKDFYAAYRIRALNDSMSRFFSTLKSSADPTSAFKFYLLQRTAIMEDVNVRNAKKRSTTHEPGHDELSPTKRAKQSNFGAAQGSMSNRNPPSPEKQQLGTDPMPHTNGGTLPQSTAFVSAPTLTPSQKNSSSSSPSGKRKATEELTSQNVGDVNERPLKQVKTQQLNGSTDVSNDGSGGGSNTSNIFKNILDSPAKSPQKSPTKKPVASEPSVSKDSPARPNPFSSLPIPKSPPKSAFPPPVNFGVKPVDSSNAKPPSTGLFGSKVDAPSNSVGSPAPALNIFGTKSSETSNLGEPAKPSSNIFGSKPAGFSMPGSSAGSMNFAAQFGQQAAKDKKDSEQKLMERDMDNDMDSDEDEATWIENWKEKRRLELAKLDALTKTGKGFSFGAPQSKAKETPEVSQSSKPSFGSSLPAPSQSGGWLSPANISRTPTPVGISSSSGSVLDGHAPGKPAVTFGNNIFGHLSDSQKSNDADDESVEESDPGADADSENKDPDYTPEQESGSGSGTPVEETGPGIASATRSSLFDFTPSKTSSIFGQSASGSATPTQTPRGGLFDRVTRDSFGNPVRAISTDEKENTQPSPTNVVADFKNPFSALNKSQTVPRDQTWKTDSPIKFGSATPTSDTAPTLSVTAATPTKNGSPAGIFANLNSSSGHTSAPFSNLFGNSGITKPAASTGPGFNFGAASNTSSLFPSVTSSRATTPGATTDGDSAAEDPDAEKHEQINLTAGGPGEEDEEVVFEVRAKAMQFVQKEGDGSAWETKGLGPLRILKHKETNATRMLLRSDPRGTIVLNKGILNVKYEAVKKTVKVMTAGESGKGLETWLLQVKTEDLAQQLAETLEANKSI